MIHYHGGPITPERAALVAWQRRHAMISFEEPRQVELAAEVCQSFALDNGAFSAWSAGRPVDWGAYADWIRQWYRHPGFDFCLIPDVIDGDEDANVALIEWWQGLDIAAAGVPVWHMHESLEMLAALAKSFPRVALGSSGQYAKVGTEQWWARMGEAMDAICDDAGRPIAKLHGLRMLNPTVFSQLPLASADSCNVARNIGIDKRWKGTYLAMTKETRAMILQERIELHASASRWTCSRGIQMNLELVG